MHRQVLHHYRPSAKILPKIAKLISKYQNFLLTTHVGSDADGVGSQIGLYYLLKKLKKRCWILNNEPPPEIFLNSEQEGGIGLYQEIEIIETYLENQDVLFEKLKPFFVLILDNSDFGRSEDVGRASRIAGCSWASIDHHIVKAEKNLCVDSNYAATCEIIWDLYHYYKIKIPDRIAKALYIGLIADSGNFRYDKTSLRTHIAGAELSAGISTDAYYRLIYENNKFDRLHLVKRILNKAIFNKKLGFVIGEIKHSTKRGLHLNKGRYTRYSKSAHGSTRESILPLL